MNAFAELKEQASADLINQVKQLPLQLTVLDVAGFLGVSRSTAYKLIHTDGFPALKIPGFKRVVVPKKLFLDWYSANFHSISFDSAVFENESRETPLAGEEKKCYDDVV